MQISLELPLYNLINCDCIYASMGNGFSSHLHMMTFLDMKFRVLSHLRSSINARTFRCMARLYCTRFHQSEEMCSECAEVLNYTLERHRKCPFGALKPVCSKCEIHCFQKDIASRVRTIMSYAGPRMTYRHPLLALYHVFERMAFRKTHLKEQNR